MRRFWFQWNLFFLMLFCSLIFIYPSFASINSSCSSSSYLVAYINGINTLKEDARHDAMRVLFPAIGSTYNGEKVKVILAYNQSRNVFVDLVDVLRQKLNEYPNVARDLLFKAITTGIFGSALPQELQDFFSKYHIDKIRDYGYVSYSDTDLQEIVGAVRSNVIEGQKIILVPHSQGNLYANAAYASLTTGANAISTNMIKIVGIASPGAYIAGDGSYLTSSNDVVISSLRSSGLSVLNSNIAVSVTIDDILGHSMRDVYLNENREGRAKFIEMLHASMDALSSSGVQAGQGPITVTLTWGSERDVDLHVFEPDGNHVYYGNKFGTVGLLDLDDTTSYGPEHYFTTCDNLRTGTYKIGVNYFYGLLPEKATVTISIPSGLSTRTVNLPTSFGSAGNDNPIMVGTIDVTKNSEGKYAFDLH